MELPVFGGPLPPSFVAQPLSSSMCIFDTTLQVACLLPVSLLFVRNRNASPMHSAALDIVHNSTPHWALLMLGSAQHCLQKRIFATAMPKTLGHWTRTLTPQYQPLLR